MAMRPPVPVPTLSRRAKLVLGAIAVLLVLFTVIGSLTNVYVDYLWFAETDYTEVFWTELQSRALLFAVAGVAPEVMGIGPIEAVPKALKAAGLTMDDIDLVELNEAFASQSLAVIRQLGMDRGKVNVNGGAIALGHPMGATGAKLTIQLLDELHARGGRYGLVTMCVGGGMGAAGVFENLRAA